MLNVWLSIVNVTTKDHMPKYVELNHSTSIMILNLLKSLKENVLLYSIWPVSTDLPLFWLKMCLVSKMIKLLMPNFYKKIKLNYLMVGSILITKFKPINFKVNIIKSKLKLLRNLRKPIWEPTLNRINKKMSNRWLLYRSWIYLNFYKFHLISSNEN